jgi:hypothetical protein
MTVRSEATVTGARPPRQESPKPTSTITNDRNHDRRHSPADAVTNPESPTAPSNPEFQHPASDGDGIDRSGAHVRL